MRSLLRRLRRRDDQALIDVLWRERDAARAQLVEERRVRRGERVLWEAERRQHLAAVAEARRNEAGAQKALVQAYEPCQGSECTKVRLRDRDEAERYARQVEHDTGREIGALKGYACRATRPGGPECPRQPITSARYWHICNVDPAMRTGRPDADKARSNYRAAAKREGRTIGQRVSPLDVPKTRKATA